jgi:aryl-alcohol dehydrogenase-like predicted oxidoreductase
MRYRPFGGTGGSVSEIGFGAWAIGGSWWGPSDDDDSRAALRRAADLGVTFFDTAQVYGDGHSEELLGEFTRGMSPRPIVATKLPPKNYVWDLGDDANIDEVFPARYITKSVESSLTRLKTDRLDVYQFHTWSRAFNARTEWQEAVRKLKDAGKIRWCGISAPNRGEECILDALSTGLIDCVQIIYNIFQARVARTVFPTIQKLHLGLIVRVPLFEGALSGRFTTETTFPPDDFRSEYFGGNKLEKTVERVEELKKVAAELRPGMPLAELALRFTLAHPAVSTVIPGIRTVQQAEADIAASDGTPLTSAELETLAAFEWDKDFWSLENV